MNNMMIRILTPMPKKQKPHTLARIRQWDDALDEWDDLDDMQQHERIRKQPREDRPAAGKQPDATRQERRQRQKEWGREFARLQRLRRRDNVKP
jgi:hypothetical protein